MIKIGEYYVIESKTSSNNGRIVKVLNIYNNSDLARVILSTKGKGFQISLNSLKEISKYDIIRNLNNECLELVLKKSINKKKLLKEFEKMF